jgi:hypothetical protein
LIQVDDADRVLSVQFDWKGQRKPVTTLLVGTSPEFELALYTLCFVAGGQGTRLVVVLVPVGTCGACLLVRCAHSSRLLAGQQQARGRGGVSCEYRVANRSSQ